MSYEAFIAACSKECRCCPLCFEHPCQALLAGGFCERSRCTCDDELPDYDETGEKWPEDPDAKL
jgi:hypothetical protein